MRTTTYDFHAAREANYTDAVDEIIGRTAFFTTCDGVRLEGTVHAPTQTSSGYPIIRLADGRWARCDDLIELAVSEDDGWEPVGTDDAPDMTEEFAAREETESALLDADLAAGDTALAARAALMAPHPVGTRVYPRHLPGLRGTVTAVGIDHAYGHPTLVMTLDDGTRRGTDARQFARAPRPLPVIDDVPAECEWCGGPVGDDETHIPMRGTTMVTVVCGDACADAMAAEEADEDEPPANPADVDRAERAVLAFVDAHAESLTHALRVAANKDDADAASLGGLGGTSAMASVLRQSAASRRELAGRLDALVAYLADVQPDD